jgi:hypothetical protein
MLVLCKALSYALYMLCYLQDRLPQCASLDSLARQPLLLVTLIQGLELLTPAVRKPGSLVRAEEGPLTWVCDV